MKKAECPVCHNLTEHFVFKSKIFIPHEIDTDNFVISYQWIDKTYKECRPSFYALWTCTTCGYADFPEFFEKYLASPTYDFAKLRDIILKETADRDGVLFKLLSNVRLDVPELEFETAMNMHLLAVYCHDYLNENNQDYEKLGRLYLRTSWLFREFENNNVPLREYAGYKDYWDFLNSFRAKWPTIPYTEEISYGKAAHYFSEIIYQDFIYDEAVKNIKLILLAAELYLRSKDYRQAYNILHSVIALGMDVRNDIRKTMDEKKKANELSQQDERFFSTRIQKISEQLSDVHDKFIAVQEQWRVQYEDVITEVFTSNNGAEREVILQKLADSKVPQEIIASLKNRDPRLKTGDDKGFWKFWKK
jgi:hypothetical protein